MRTAIFLSFIALVCSVSASLNHAPNVSKAENAPDAERYVRSLTELRDNLGILEPFSFEIESERKTSSGARKLRLRQKFNGIPIRVATLHAGQNENGFYTGSVSGLCPSIRKNFDTTVSNTKAELKRALASYMNAKDPELPDGKTVTVGRLKNFKREKQIHIDDTTGSPVVVYFVTALVDIGLSDGAYIRYPQVIFKAGHLEVLAASLPVKRESCGDHAKSCPNAKGGNEKERGLKYGPKKREVCLNTSFENNKCVLQNGFITVKTVNNAWKRKKAKVVSFDCEKGPEDDKFGACSASADAFYYAQVFYDVLHKWGRLDRTHREPHTLYVHFGDGYPNSFWDGESTTFGDGADRTYPYAISEIIGHEMCHAVTDSFGNLVFDNEARAINEAFSDICGKAVTYYLNGDGAGWKFADAVMRNPDKALRYFNDPTLDGSSIDSYNNYNAGVDPYEGMGIYLKAFYNIVAQEKIRFRDAFETFVYANQIYWNEETSLVDGACGVLRAARDLGLNHEAFRSAFGGVDISLTDAECSLKGSEDPIIYGDECVDGEIRHAEINSFRTARYVVRPALGKTTIKVYVACTGDGTVDIKAKCADGSYQSYGRFGAIPIAGNTEVIVTAEGDHIVEAKVHFEFE